MIEQNNRLLDLIDMQSHSLDYIINLYRQGYQINLNSRIDKAASQLNKLSATPIDSLKLVTRLEPHSLAPSTCIPKANYSGIVGDIISIVATPSGGTSPYTVTIDKGQTLLKQFTGVTEVQKVEFDYQSGSSDIGTQTISVSTKDACLHGVKTCAECYNVTISPVTTTQPGVTIDPILAVGLLGLLTLGIVVTSS